MHKKTRIRHTPIQMVSVLHFVYIYTIHYTTPIWSIFFYTDSWTSVYRSIFSLHTPAIDHTITLASSPCTIFTLIMTYYITTDFTLTITSILTNKIWFDNEGIYKFKKRKTSCLLNLIIFCTKIFDTDFCI